ncbi:MAG: SCO family protein [Alphaproteobacteria bacterium]|nr:SCO family protein [Alphaproteobacteria bacterium]MBU1560716.1 SCO family protein [Alphaproteobacteria bacterium]MBU2302925.1 SCO family protein [Alphaproteobacteria bacterium]MBU2367652.1 SCO family protein [Alphaproteobacteria bacterium]
MRVFLWILVALAAAGVAFLAFGPRPATVAAGEAFYARPFQLLDQDGTAVTEASFLGKPSAWFYGFTHCPDVCPTALAEMTAILEALGSDADKLQVVFVSVDPERDTPSVMKDYVEYFDARITGLTGDLDQVTKMAKDRYIFFGKVPMDGGEYLMEHQASIQLVTADGQFFGTLAAEEGFTTRVAKVRRLIEEG